MKTKDTLFVFEKATFLQTVSTFITKEVNMGIEALKETLHQIIDTGDDKFIKMLYFAATEYKGEDGHLFLETDMEEFEKRRANRINGASKVYDWQEAKKMITGK